MHNIKLILLSAVGFLFISGVFASDVCDSSHTHTNTGDIKSFRVSVSNDYKTYNLLCDGDGSWSTAMHIIWDGKVNDNRMYLPAGYHIAHFVEAKDTQYGTFYFDIWRDDNNDGIYETNLISSTDTTKDCGVGVYCNLQTSSWKEIANVVGPRNYRLDLGHDNGFFQYLCLDDIEIRGKIFVVYSNDVQLSISSNVNTITGKPNEMKVISAILKNTMANSDPSNPEYPAFDAGITFTINGNVVGTVERKEVLLEDESFSINTEVQLPAKEGNYILMLSPKGHNVIFNDATGSPVYINVVVEGCPLLCDDGNPCTNDYCDTGTNYECKHETIGKGVISCRNNADCNDNNPSTSDTCELSGTCDSYCSNTMKTCPSGQLLCSGNCITPACSSAYSCDDGNPDTDDSCENPSTCSAVCRHITKSCSTGKILCNGICTSPACTIDSNCNDNDDCTIDRCNNPETCTSSCSNAISASCQTKQITNQISGEVTKKVDTPLITVGVTVVVIIIVAILGFVALKPKIMHTTILSGGKASDNFGKCSHCGAPINMDKLKEGDVKCDHCGSIIKP